MTDLEPPLDRDAVLVPDLGFVQLSVPADVSFVGVVRSLTAGLAARCTLTIDEIEDLRIAVDEACALLIPEATAGSELRATFEVGTTDLTFSVKVQAAPGASLDRTGFAWTLLEALADSVTTHADGGQLGITLSKTSEIAVLNGTRTL